MKRRLLAGAGVLGAIVLSMVGYLTSGDAAPVRTERRWKKPRPALSLLSPPGAGYDATNVSLTTGSGVAVTVARTSTQTCEISPGVLTSVAANKPCVESGALKTEPAGTNLALQSAALTSASWSILAAGTGGAPSRSADVTVAPDGTTSAEQLAFSAVAGGGNASILAQDFTATAAAYSASIYLKAASGTPTVYLWMATGGTTYAGNASACVLSSTTWTWCKLENRTLTAATWAIRFGVDTRDASQSAQSASTIYAWGAQVETGSVATSYIPTGAATATRTAQTATVATPATLSTTEGAAKVCITPAWTGAAPAEAWFLDGSNVAATARILIVAAAGNTTLTSTNSTVAPAVEAGFVAGVEKCYRVAWSATRGTLVVENLASGASASANGFTGFGAFTANLGIGHRQATGLVQPTAKVRIPCVGTSPDGCR